MGLYSDLEGYVGIYRVCGLGFKVPVSGCRG